MTRATILLDTNILWWEPSLRNSLTEKIKSNTLQVYIPTLIHAERIRQIADQKGEDFSIHVIRQFIGESKFKLLPFTVADAETVADVWLALKANGATDDDWDSHRLDILLCAIALSRGYTLVTNDKGKHFDVIPLG